MSSALFESHIAITDFRELLGTDSTKSTLNKQRFDVSSGPADSGGFLFPCTLVVLWRKTSPGAEMLRGGEHGHIHSNLRNDADCGKGLDTRRRHNKVKLRKVFLSSSQNQRFQIKLTQLETIHVGTNDAELFSLFSTHLSVHGSKHLFIGRFHAFCTEARNICDFLCRIFQNAGSNCGGRLAEHIREHIVQFEIGNGQTVLSPIFLAGSEVGKFPSVTHQIPKLADVCWWNEAPGDKIVLEDVGNPLSVPLIRFLPSNCFHILGVSKDNIAGGLQDVVNGNPILPS